MSRVGALAAAGLLGFLGNLLVARIRTRAGPLIGLAITAVILKVTWDSWRTVSGAGHQH